MVPYAEIELLNEISLKAHPASLNISMDIRNEYFVLLQYANLRQDRIYVLIWLIFFCFPFLFRSDFDGDQKTDNVAFIIKRIKIHNDPTTPGYKFPGNYGVEKYLEIFSEDNYDDFCLAYIFTYRFVISEITVEPLSNGPASYGILPIMVVKP